MAKTAPPGKPDTNQAPNLGGRPRFIIDYKLLETLCGFQCTREECAVALGCSDDTLTRRLKEDYAEAKAANPDEEPWDRADGFDAFFKRFRVKGFSSLRQAQFKSAVTNQNPAMLKWLGINLLDQTDRIDHVSHDGSMSPAGLDHFYGKAEAAVPAPGSDGNSNGTSGNA